MRIRDGSTDVCSSDLLYLDCDGVLADFDRAATELLGMPPRTCEKRRGIGAFWREIERHPDFYGTLPLMPEAMRLFEPVRHLDPVILTGLPRGTGDAPQQVRWAAEHFPGTRILPVLAVHKRARKSGVQGQRVVVRLDSRGTRLFHKTKI